MTMWHLSCGPARLRLVGALSTIREHVQGLPNAAPITSGGHIAAVVHAPSPNMEASI